MKVRRPAALSAFVAAVGNPRSPLFGHFLRRGQFGPRFGPTLASVASVRAWLRQAGLSPGRTSADRLLIPVKAAASAVRRAFGVSLLRYRLPGGRIAYANAAAPRVPAAIAPYVGGVLGLSDLYPDQAAIESAPTGRRQASHAAARPGAARPGAAGPMPCSSVPSIDLPHAVNVFAGHYGMTPLYQMGDTGSGVQVAVFEQEPDLTTDITAYESCFNVTAPVDYFPVDGGAGTGAGSGEATLDLENIAGLSPGATIDVYQGPDSTDADTADIYQAMVDSGDQVLYTSWGTCEAETNQALISTEQTLFAQAATQGQTVIAAAGDTGSTDCFGADPTNAALSVRVPASEQNVLAVGGTTLTGSADTVWNDSASSKEPAAAGSPLPCACPAIRTGPPCPA